MWEVDAPTDYTPQCRSGFPRQQTYKAKLRQTKRLTRVNGPPPPCMIGETPKRWFQYELMRVVVCIWFLRRSPNVCKDPCSFPRLHEAKIDNVIGLRDAGKLRSGGVCGGVITISDPLVHVRLSFYFNKGCAKFRQPIESRPNFLFKNRMFEFIRRLEDFLL